MISRKLLQCAAPIALMSLFAGCSSWNTADNRTASDQRTASTARSTSSNTGTEVEKSAALGGVGGAVAGAVVAGPVGAVVGGAGGAIAGSEIAKKDQDATATAASRGAYSGNTASSSGSTMAAQNSASRSAATTPAAPTTPSSPSTNMNTGTSSTSDSSTASSRTSSSAGSSMSSAHSTMDNSFVRGVQQSLNDKGYNAGQVDGIWGPKTESALRSYQHAEGLTASGRVDDETRSRLGL